MKTKDNILMGWDWDSQRNWHEHRHHHHRHGGNWWIAPLVIIDLIILTHGWILILPLIALAAFAFVGFVLPKLAYHMQNGDWHGGDWGNWSEMRRQHMQEWGEKRKGQGGWGNWHGWNHERGDQQGWGNWRGWNEEQRSEGDKPKRKNSDDIEYV